MKKKLVAHVISTKFCWTGSWSYYTTC
jgi:hypothetical protein